MKRSYQWGELDPSLGVGASASLVAASSTVNKGTQEVTIEGPKLIQPSSQQKAPPERLPTELYRQDVLSLHTIQLLKYNHDMIAAASSHHHGNSNRFDDRKFHLASALTEPSLDDLTKQQSPDICKIDENGRLPRYTLNNGTVEIDELTARNLSHRAAGTVCAHSGYDSSEELALETITDVLNEFLNKVCQLLRVAVDREAMTGCTGFQDTLTQILQEIGVGSPASLYTFWKKRIKNYHQVTMKRTKEIKKKIQRQKTPIAVTSKSLSREDEMPSQIFADSTFKSNDSSNDAPSGPEREDEDGWYGPSVKTEQLEDSCGGENNGLEQVDDEIVDSSSYTDSSSHMAGSSSPWDGYQGTPPPKKKKK